MITGPTGEIALTVGERALREGVLIGRYARCDGAVVGQAETLSRVLDPHEAAIALFQRAGLVDDPLQFVPVSEFESYGVPVRV